MDRARGEGDLVGEMGMGEGEGVRARGERGMWPTDLRLEGEWRVLALTCNLCFSPLRPCRDDGRPEIPLPAI